MSHCLKQVLERMERLSKALEKLQNGWDSIVIDASGGDGDVELSVDHKGRLISLSLAEGCTQRYTNLALEELDQRDSAQRRRRGRRRGPSNRRIARHRSRG